MKQKKARACALANDEILGGRPASAAAFRTLTTGVNMNNNTFLTICIAVIALTGATGAVGQAPTRNHNLVPFYEDVRGGACSQTMPGVGMITPNTPLDTVLFNRTFRGQPTTQFCDPVLNPDGSQMTLGQYNTV